jgi:hypothetical protein
VQLQGSLHIGEGGRRAKVKVRKRFEDAVLLAMQIEEVTISQVAQVAWRKAKYRFPLSPERENSALPTL